MARTMGEDVGIGVRGDDKVAPADVLADPWQPALYSTRRRVPPCFVVRVVIQTLATVRR